MSNSLDALKKCLCGTLSGKSLAIAREEITNKKYSSVNKYLIRIFLSQRMQK